MHNELWKVIPDTDGRYEASDRGRVRALFPATGRPRPDADVIDGELLKQHLGDRGFMLVSIDGCTRSVASCVLSAFVGVRPTPEHRACYRDSDKLNANLENLSWLTPLENNQLTMELGRKTLRPTQLIGNIKHYQCNKCLEWFPPRGFYRLAGGTSRHGNRMTHCGLHSECRKCMNERRQAYRQKYGDGGAPSSLQKILPVMEELDGIHVALDEPDNGGIAKRVIAARERIGISRNELARRCGVHEQTIQKLEKNICIPREKTLRKIFAAMTLAQAVD